MSSPHHPRHIVTSYIIIHPMIKFLLDILFPIRCLGNCGQWDTWLCKSCQQKIIKPQKIILSPPTSIRGLYYLNDYKNNLLQTIIHQLKYDYSQELAPLLSHLLNKIIDQKFDYLIPIPLHRKRYLERGFNQSLLLAQKINIPLLENVIRRKKYTIPQVQLTEKQRLKNITQSFIINPEKAPLIRAKKILLLDDVYTTGATMQECARILEQYQVHEIWGLVVAKG